MGGGAFSGELYWNEQEEEVELEGLAFVPARWPSLTGTGPAEYGHRGRELGRRCWNVCLYPSKGFCFLRGAGSKVIGSVRRGRSFWKSEGRREGVKKDQVSRVILHFPPVTFCRESAGTGRW